MEAAPDIKPKQQLDPNRCDMWLAKKSRFCTQPRVAGGGGRCGHHGGGSSLTVAACRGGGSTNSTRSGERVTCPVDPTHTVYANRLGAHVKKCHATKAKAQLESFTFYRHEINSGVQASYETLELPSWDTPELEALADRVEALFAQHLSIEDHVDLSPRCADYLAASNSVREKGRGERRHLIQASSFVSTLERRGLLFSSAHQEEAGTAQSEAPASEAFLELGAGRGTLARAIGAANDRAAFALIERAGVRHTADQALRRQTSSGGRLSVIRARIDLTHFYLPGLATQLVGASGGGGGAVGVVAVAKHLCGVATDLGLRSLLNQGWEEEGGEEEVESRKSKSSEGDLWPGRSAALDPTGQFAVKGVCIACCCHHRCLWDSYVAKGWFEDHGLGRREFARMAKWSSWACDGVADGKRPAEAEGAALTRDDGRSGGCGQCGAAADGATSADFCREDPFRRAALGRKCKRLIDRGRLAFLQSMGFEGEISHYCDAETSPENALLVAWPPQPPSVEHESSAGRRENAGKAEALAAVRERGTALRDCSEELKNGPEVVEAALR